MSDGSPHVVDHLSAYLDGDLGEQLAARVRAHLSECPSCAQAAGEMNALIAAARALDRPEPPPTLWPAIEGALARHERGPFGWRVFAFGLAAGAAVALAVVWVGRTQVAAPGGPSLARIEAAPAVLPATATAATTTTTTTGAGDPLLAEAEGEFQRAAAAYERSIDKLRTLLAREQTLWSVDERVRYADRLSRLDEAISRSRETARQRPGDTAGNEILFAAYQKKIEFLAAAVHRGAPGPGGNAP
ncbi:MAG TPA: zf-HC2 domain-containing protein [Polyangia bacterium]|nr:zf-HC2 domain-containing protein [Polyangia bacterium]